MIRSTNSALVPPPSFVWNCKVPPRDSTERRAIGMPRPAPRGRKNRKPLTCGSLTQGFDLVVGCSTQLIFFKPGGCHSEINDWRTTSHI